MKILTILLFIILPVFIILPGSLLAQDQSHYKPIDQIGWELPDFSLLEDLDQEDAGSAKFLLVLNKKGIIKKAKIISSTFSPQAEIKLINYLEGQILVRKPNDQNLVKQKGILDLSMASCTPNPGI